MAILFFMLHCSPEMERDTIAEVGPERISVSEFKDYYQFNPGLKGVSDSGTATRLVLTSLIAEKMIAAEEIRTDQKQSERLFLQMEQYEKEAVIEGFWQEKIFSEISISENDLHEAYWRSKISKAVQYLTFDDQEDAQRAYLWFETHGNFEDLAAIRGYRPAEIPVDTLRYNGSLPNLQEQAYAMKPGDVSEPVREGEFYVIIRILNERRNMFSSEEEFQRQKPHLRKEVRKLKAFRYFQSYVQSRLQDETFVLDRSVFKTLMQALEEELFSHRPHADDNYELLQTQTGQMDSLREQIVVRFSNGTTWNGEKLLQTLAVAPYPIVRKDRTAFRKSMLQVTRQTLNDELLFRHAVSQGLDQSPYVRQQKTIWKDYSYFKKGLAGIIRQIKHKVSMDTTRAIPDSSRMQDLLVEQYLLTRLPEYPVKINHAILDTLRISRTDMVVFKTHFPKRTVIPPLQLFRNMPRLNKAIWSE